MRSYRPRFNGAQQVDTIYDSDRKKSILYRKEQKKKTRKNVVHAKNNNTNYSTKNETGEKNKKYKKQKIEN